MKERKDSPNPQEIKLPPEVLEFVKIAREDYGYASGNAAEELPNGDSLYRFSNENLYYEDCFRIYTEDDLEKVRGMEIVTEGGWRETGGGFNRLFWYGYRGGLTKEGTKLDKDTVFFQLQEFLRNHSDQVRLGREPHLVFSNREWHYESLTSFMPTLSQWHDIEELKSQGITHHRLFGDGKIYQSNLKKYSSDKS
jgi:hypothetical protein